MTVRACLLLVTLILCSEITYCINVTEMIQERFVRHMEDASANTTGTMPDPELELPPVTAGAYWKYSSNGNVPSCAVKAGYDYPGQCYIYVCRVQVGNQLVIGKVVPKRNCAYYVLNGVEKKATRYWVLTNHDHTYTWQKPSENGGIPWGALAGGYDSSWMATFIVRGYVSSTSKSRSCGEYYPQTKKCILPWDRKGVEPSKFEFLVAK